jgi:tetratricopeptide (TPR) repeat protein
LRDLLERAPGAPARLRARGFRVLAGSAHQKRDFDVADPAYDESLRLFVSVGDRRGVASVRTRLAYRAATLGDLALARRLLKESQKDAHGRWPLIDAQNTSLLGQLARDEGRLDEAEELLQRARWLAESLRWPWWESNLCIVLLDLALRRGDSDEAERRGREALAIDVEHEHPLSGLHAVAGLARTALARDDLERAGLLWGAAAERSEGTWFRVAQGWVEVLEAETRPAFVAAREQGRKLELWDAAATALAEDAHTVP